MNRTDKIIKKIEIFSSFVVIAGTMTSSNVLILKNDIVNFQSSSIYIDLRETYDEKDNLYFYREYKSLPMNPFINNKICLNEAEYLNSIEMIDKEINKRYKENTFSLESKLMMDALFSNENITISDKSRLFSFLYYFDDNPYINREITYKKIKNLKIDHIKCEDTGAQFLKDENRIIIYNNYNISISHEMFHLTMANEPDNLGSFINESMTLILNNEYFEYNSNTNEMNDDRVLFTKMMIELLGKDTMLEAYSKNDWEIIENKLLSIGFDINKTDEIYNLMLDYSDIFNKSGCDLEVTRNNSLEIRKELSKNLNEYYSLRKFDNPDSLFELYDDQFITGNKVAVVDRKYFNRKKIDMENNKDDEVKVL